MSYFSDNYLNISLPFEGPSAVGLRNAQHGAIHAIASHVTIRNDPAIVVMPTGSGKTAVLLTAPFLLRSNRVLIVTPSVLVRDQIHGETLNFPKLRELGVITLANEPKTTCIKNRLNTTAKWESLRKFDISVATPKTVSPAEPGVSPAPDDLFDLVIIDEAHHSPAKTWSEILRAFPKAKKLLFTATPFRRDRQEIKGKFIYSYPLRLAYEDKIFSKIQYIPVSVLEGQPGDVAIAKAAEKTLKADREEGLDHCLMVRTDSKKRANELAKVYEKNTKLKLKVIHSGYSQRHVQKSIDDLKSGTLDGILCVDMMGEGFDFPALKIAAVHAPHKSLAVTLQFIGRFARTGASKIGEAKLLAIPNDIEFEAKRLYEEDAVWPEIVLNLAGTRVDAEVKFRESLESFEEIETTKDEDVQDLSLFALRPYCHLKVYEVFAPVDIGMEFESFAGLNIVFKRVSSDLNSVVFLTKREEKPRWLDIDLLSNAEYDLIVIYYDQSSNLLFINSSQHHLSLYEAIAEMYTGEDHRPLPLHIINRVLRGLERVECFNLGMRNRVVSASTETYRTVAGSKAHEAVGPTDSQLFHRGHIAARAEEDGGSTTLGYSSSSKIWSNKNVQIPELIDWCKKLAKKLSTGGEIVTGSKLDNLSVGKSLEKIEGAVIAADWHFETYHRMPRLAYGKREYNLLDAELTVIGKEGTEKSVSLLLSTKDFQWPFTFHLNRAQFFQKTNPSQKQLTVQDGDDTLDFISYINNCWLSFYLHDFTRFSGHEIFPVPVDIPPFDRSVIQSEDWAALGVDITKEFGAPSSGKASIHEFLKKHLSAMDFHTIFYDHRVGEVADFIAIRNDGGVVEVWFFHCKGSAEDFAGDRVDDIYEVAGQVVKSVHWVQRPEELVNHMRKRHGKSTFIKGDKKDFEEALSATLFTRFVIALVQPGLSCLKMTEDNLRLLAAAEKYIKGSGAEKMVVIGST